MTINELEEKLTGHLDEYNNEIRTLYPDSNTELVSQQDIHEASRHTFYLINSFKNELIKYLKEHK